MIFFFASFEVHFYVSLQYYLRHSSLYFFSYQRGCSGFTLTTVPVATLSCHLLFLFSMNRAPQRTPRGGGGFLWSMEEEQNAYDLNSSSNRSGPHQPEDTGRAQRSPKAVALPFGGRGLGGDDETDKDLPYDERPIGPAATGRGGGGGTSRGMGGHAPRAVPCYLCGRGFGTSSLRIHLSQCYSKEMAAWQKGEREEKPVDPATHERQVEERRLARGVDWSDGNQRGGGIGGKPKQAPKPRIEEEEMEVSLVECPNCERKFLPDRLKVHQKSCRPGHAARPVRGKSGLPEPEPHNALGSTAAPSKLRSNAYAPDTGDRPRGILEEERDKNGYQYCPNCARTFAPSRLVVHLKSCRPGHTAKPVGRGGAGGMENTRGRR